MKTWKILSTLALTGTLWLGASQLCEASSLVVQRITISLTGYAEQDPVYRGNTTTWPLQKIKVTEKTIIAMMADTMGVYFSPSAQLVMVDTANGSNIYVKDAGQFTDVSACFPLWNDSDALVWPRRQTVTDSCTTVSGTMYSSDHWVIDAGGLEFGLRGLCTSSVKDIQTADDSYTLWTSSTSMAGYAGTGDATILLTGTLKVSSSLLK